MSALATLGSAGAGFRTAGSHEGTSLRVRMEGEASYDVLDALGRVLDATHDEAIRLAVKDVVMDVTKLEFLSSSGVKQFVMWLRKASEAAPDAGYHVRFVSSPRVPWQRRGLEALRCFAPDRVSVETSCST
ncbi:MAG: hypothetical protein KIT84_30400 [Labilithrix sp.]|nr:hypothetical protein [Labilithrix sp.]MCW5815377.1 hypothetical protein [Labilithrix sp.]